MIVVIDKTLMKVWSYRVHTQQPDQSHQRHQVVAVGSGRTLKTQWTIITPVQATVWTLSTNTGIKAEPLGSQLLHFRLCQDAAVECSSSEGRGPGAQGEPRHGHRLQHEVRRGLFAFCRDNLDIIGRLDSVPMPRGPCWRCWPREFLLKWSTSISRISRNGSCSRPGALSPSWGIGNIWE